MSEKENKKKLQVIIKDETFIYYELILKETDWNDSQFLSAAIQYMIVNGYDHLRKQVDDIVWENMKKGLTKK